MIQTNNHRLRCAATAIVALLAHGCADDQVPEGDPAIDEPQAVQHAAVQAEEGSFQDATGTECAIADHDESDELQVEEIGNLYWIVRSRGEHAGADLQVTVLNRASGQRTDAVLFESIDADTWQADATRLVPDAWSGDPLQVWFEVLELEEGSRATRAFEYVNLGSSSSGWSILDPMDAERERVEVKPTLQIADPWLVLPDEEAQHAADEVATGGSGGASYVPGEGPDELTAANDSVRASNMKFCFKISTNFTDNGNGEDYWQSDSAWRARGMHTQIYGRYGMVWSGNLGDGLGSGDPGSGCTPTIGSATPKTDGTFDVAIFSDGIWINYNTLHVEDCNSLDSDGDCLSSLGRNVYFGIDAPPSNTTTTFTVTPAAASFFSATMAAAYSLWRHNAGENNETFTVLLNMNSSVYAGGHVEIFRDHEDQKFVIAHEMGHMIGARAMGSRVLTGGSCNDVTITDPARPCRQQGSGNHSILSKEESRCAMAEGFAHFFAADVFNSHNQDDCSFTYYKTTNGVANPVVDCEGANPGFPVGPYEQCWYGGWGYGNELSWMRQFWDIHTYGSTNPSFNTMVSWIEKVSALSDKNAYQRYHAAAEASGVSSTVEAAWKGLDAYNTVCNSDDPCQ